MIKLTRVRTKSAIPTAFREPRRITQALKLLVENGARREFDQSYWKKAKKQLKAESAGKCAYCEAPTDTVAHGDVEHFRPKSVYWWLAYCYDNYLFSCQLCNQKFKGDAFPLADDTLRLIAPVLAAGASEEEKVAFIRQFAPDPVTEAHGRPWADHAAALKAEGCLLLDPYVDDPDEFFQWEADPVLKEVNLRPRNPASEPYVRAAETYYGLNRPELQKVRWRAFTTLETLKMALDAPQLPDDLRARVRQEILHLISPEAAFAGMARYFVHRVWQLPL